MNEKEKYAVEWNESAQFFYNQKSYNHFCDHIQGYKRVLEIGCGTGQSTLALLSAGYSVIAIEQNPYCIEKAKSLLLSAGYGVNESSEEAKPGTVCFLEQDITDPLFLSTILPKLSFDLVVCWNIGSYWDKKKLEDAIPKMLKYGLSADQIRENTESSYVELLIWNACKIAKDRQCAIQIVDRGTYPLTKYNDPYYFRLKKEFGFKTIKYDNIKATTLSSGGRLLISKGKVTKDKEIPIVFIIVLMR